eukprot:2300580-Lingulodinium_polyedra.AAC.1
MLSNTAKSSSSLGWRSSLRRFAMPARDDRVAIPWGLGPLRDALASKHVVRVGWNTHHACIACECV